MASNLKKRKKDKRVTWLLRNNRNNINTHNNRAIEMRTNEEMPYQTVWLLFRYQAKHAIKISAISPRHTPSYADILFWQLLLISWNRTLRTRSHCCVHKYGREKRKKWTEEKKTGQNGNARGLTGWMIKTHQNTRRPEDR